MVQDELAMLEKAGIIPQNVSPWCTPIVIMPKKAQSRETGYRIRYDCVLTIEYWVVHYSL